MDGLCEKLGPFQRMARNMGLDRETVARLPGQWPYCRSDWSDIADVLYEAGYPAGDDLIRVAQQLWQARPPYLR